MGDFYAVPFELRPPAKVPPEARPPEADLRPPPARQRPPVCRDLAELAPAFRERLERVLEQVEAQGYRTRVWETLRTPERGAWLKARGRSQSGRRSMHCLRAAADVICRRHRWDCDVHECRFFEALGRAARRAGLFWGGDWRTIVDQPHIQAISVADQDELRRVARQGGDLEGAIAELMRPPRVIG